MTQVSEKFLTNYDVSTLRDVDYLGQSPSKNSFLKYKTSTQKWQPSKLDGVSTISVGKVLLESDLLEQGRFAILKDPELGLFELTIEGDLVVI